MTIDPIASLRQDYRLHELDEASAARDPIDQFRHWFDQALAVKQPEPNAMTLATIGANGRPAARIVLLKGVDARGFVFYTNYDSHKGRELAALKAAALTFFWVALERQVRIEGSVEQVSAQESDDYFNSRPLGSRIAAWASPQSDVIADRAVLAARYAEFEARFGDSPPRPPHWGGYRIRPDLIEFWQGRSSRLHDRLVYRLSDGQWQLSRLAP